ncbi:MAG: hypothetical protein AAGB19_14640 [Cyanobacteria bacterium P01_F01_bin.3]
MDEVVQEVDTPKVDTATWATDAIDMGPLAQYQGDPPRSVAVDALPEPPPKVLIVTTADEEHIAVLHRLAPLPGHKTLRHMAIARIPLTVGELGGRAVLVCQTKRSNTDTFLVVSTLLGCPELKYAIKLAFAVGNAYGAHPATAYTAEEGQLMGDVLLADKCISFEQGVDDCCDVIHGDGSLMHTLDSMLVRNWPKDEQAWRKVPGRPRPPRVHIGPVVSAPILQDYNVLDLLNHAQIHPHKPEGVAMEVYQIADAATRHRKLWLAANAVRNFGSIEPKTIAGHTLANTTAADFADWLLREHLMSQYLVGEIQ